MAGTGVNKAREGAGDRAFVLVVDDNADNAGIEAALLRARGFEVEIASDGESALAAVDRRRPDVVLLDVMMPWMDGMEVLERLKSSSQHAQIPVILVTGKAQDEDLLAGYSFGADYYIVKPFTARQLLYAVHLVLGRELPQ